MRIFLACVLAVAVAAPARGEQLSWIGRDWPAGVGVEPSCTADACVLLPPVDSGDAGRGEARFYVSGIVGDSFATLTNPDPPVGNAILNQSLFTGGAAAGWSFARPGGAWRAEFEALARERMRFSESDPLGGSLSFRADSGWSTMANLWRDVQVHGPVGIYLGGGVGAGGYRCVFDGNVLGTAVGGTTGISSFAWQAGGGATYAVSDRIALDLGYRFFSLAPGSADIVLTNAAGTVHDTVPMQFAASELLLSLRIYEPFRRWR